MFYVDGNKLIRKFDNEIVSIEPWGENSFRVKASPNGTLPEYENALTEKVIQIDPNISIYNDINEAKIVNGNIKAYITNRNRIVFKNSNDEILLEEYLRERAIANDMGNEDVNVQSISGFSCTLKLKAREFYPLSGGDYKLTQRFESDPKEKIFGMGQYQQTFLDLKNCKLELAHRNSQLTVPFYISNKKYGFLWNNPGIGEVNFAKNITEWKMNSTDYIDYWITSEDTPNKIIENYTNVVGRAPQMPDNLLGLWQSKMRYQTQEEVLEVAHRYKEMGITPSVLVIDFFHWTEQGHFDFDSRYWPDPKKMVDELNEMGIEVMISVWPTVSQNAKNFNEVIEKGLLVKVNRGIRVTMQQLSNTVFIDPTNPETRSYVWDKLKNSYYKNGINMFWLDVAEPGYATYDFDNYRYYLGTDLKVGNLYPNEFSKMVFDGLKEENKTPVTLIRGCWAGSQKYGTLVWSGDIDSSFGAFRNQVNTGLNMSIAGNPWWTTDIGGFHGGNINNPEFRELMIRWFQYATFSPILRMHGDRQPHKKALGYDGGGQCESGAENEIWSYGEVAQEIFMKYLNIRENLKPYIAELFKETHEVGAPIMRPVFYDYPEDKMAWEVDNQYMFGSELLIAPIIYYKQREREVYLPKGNQWVDINTNKIYDGGQFVVVEAPLESIPVFCKKESLIKNKLI
ncbi:MAG: glycoside hydrolase family 31 protein [Terrisporobacter othiniensis]|uniref:glycoside hydrolase family 31 protein n=1 Tax=Terrisporobacter othiniensis TaxID=1577792 RepID=UPI002A751AB1|nr:TIM-barrel domain-containing protein [Terrisporobacter othiniensis]MDY3375138.1 glycoside hydrolase family 31 protein [Terrisporobacter othiniensis]